MSILSPVLRPVLGPVLRGVTDAGTGPAWARTLPALRTFVAENYDQPNPHNQSVMASPPTITASASDLSGTYSNYRGFLDTTERDATFLMESGRLDMFATSFLRPSQATVDSGGTRQLVASRVSATVNADVVAFQVGGSTLPYRFIVDGQYVDLTGTLTAATSGTNYIVLTFASKAVRKITLELQKGQSVRRFALKPADSFGTKPAAPAMRGIIFGDSITAGDVATHYGDNYTFVAGDMLGLTDLWPSGVGSTGYVATLSGTRYRLSERIVSDLSDATALGRVDVVVVAMGVNDITVPGVQAQAEECYRLIRQTAPHAVVFVVGPWDAAAPAAPSADYTTVKTDIQAAVAAAGPGFYFLDPEGLEYTKVDAVHPDTAGHKVLGDWLALQVKTVLELPLPIATTDLEFYSVFGSTLNGSLRNFADGKDALSAVGSPTINDYTIVLSGATDYLRTPMDDAGGSATLVAIARVLADDNTMLISNYLSDSDVHAGPTNGLALYAQAATAADSLVTQVMNRSKTDGSTSSSDAVGIGAVPINEYQFICGRFDAATGIRKIDNITAGKSGESTADTTTYDTGGTLNIGSGHQGTGSFTGDSEFVAALGFSRAISDAEMQTLYEFWQGYCSRRGITI